VKSRGTSQLLVTETSHWKRTMKVQSWHKKQNSDNSDKKKYFRCKEKGHITKYCCNKKKNQADAFFIGMSLNDEEVEIAQRIAK